jgi:hypothetical protein
MKPPEPAAPPTLAQALQRARATLDATALPAGLLAATQAAVAAAAAPSRTAPRLAARLGRLRRPWGLGLGLGRPFAPAGAAFAALAFTGVTVLWLQPGAPPGQHRPSGLETAAAPLPEGFVAVAPPERWPAGPSSGWLVPAELGRERLAALGLPFDPGRAAERLPAELLLAPSGEVLAVRLQTVALR